MFGKRLSRALAVTTVASLLMTVVALADTVSNSVDNTVDNAAESMSLTAGGATGSTLLYVSNTNAGNVTYPDPNNPCNLAGAATLTISVASSDNAKATAQLVSPDDDSIAKTIFNACVSRNPDGTFPTGADLIKVLVTPLAAGPTTITVSQVSTTGTGVFHLAPATFTVTVAPPPNTDPILTLPASMTVEGNTLGGASVTYTGISATDAEDGDLTASVVCTPSSGSFFALGGPYTVNCSVEDSDGASDSGSFTVTVVDTTAPAFANVPTNISTTATGNSQATASWTDPTASDIVDGDRPVTCVPASGSTFNIGATTVTCTARDLSGNLGSASFIVTVSYAFDGFFRPVDNLPTLNVAKAGSAIPVKFSLSGDQGLNIFWSGYPTSNVAACDAAASEDAVEVTVTAGGSMLTYDATAGQYIYVWKTDKAWAGTCRQLRVKLADGTLHAANFKLTK